MFYLFCFEAHAQNNDSNYVTLYNNSDIIFTGVLKSKYQLPSYNDCESNKRYLLDFDLTEIQKGKRHMKMQVEYNDSSLKINEEYLIFSKKIKQNNLKSYFVEHHEKVCINCKNVGVKAVYKIINKRIFATIKEPLTPDGILPKGCGCH